MVIEKFKNGYVTLNYSTDESEKSAILREDEVEHAFEAYLTVLADLYYDIITGLNDGIQDASYRQLRF